MSLIGTRITWLLAAQAFLVTGAVLAISNALNGNVKHGVILAAIASGICIVGGVISIKTMGAVERAKCTIDLWHARIKDLYDSLGQMDEPSWLAVILGRWTEFNEPFHQESLTLSNIILSRIFTAFWAILFISSLLLMIGLLRG